MVLVAHYSLQPLPKLRAVVLVLALQLLVAVRQGNCYALHRHSLLPALKILTADRLLRACLPPGHRRYCLTKAGRFCKRHTVLLRNAGWLEKQLYSKAKAMHTTLLI